MTLNRIIKLYYAPKEEPLEQYWIAFAVDVSNNDRLVWVSTYATDDPVLLDEIDDWYDEFVEYMRNTSGKLPYLHDGDYNIDYCSGDRRDIAEIHLEYVDKEEVLE